MYRKTTLYVVGLVVFLGMMIFLSKLSRVIGASSPGTTPNQASSRTGAWVDAVVFSAASSASDAIAQLQAGQLEIYANPTADTSLFQTVQQDSNLDYSESYSSYNDLILNPAGPFFTDGRLNPFSNYKIREALNRLIDRDYMVREIFKGLATPKFFPITRDFPEYARYASACYALETAYTYNPSLAASVIATEMQAMGAYQVSGKWYYNGQPITLIFIIRVEDARQQIGDYVADQLESVSFTVDRQYKTGIEASPIWVHGDPAEGLFHIYTGGWITTAVSRDDGGNFSFFYTPNDYPIPLWQAYTPSPVFDAVALKLRDRDYQDMGERAQLFTQALGLALNDTGSGSVRIWLVDQKAFTPRRANTAIACDQAGGVASAQAWPFTVRFTGQEGGTLSVAQPDVLVDPWNPIGGSNWLYDQMPIRATQDDGLMRDPQDGSTWPQRIGTTEVIVKEGLPVTRTHEWVSLTYSPTITVPADAWVDWDAANQRFITADEKFGSDLTANVKSIVTYPVDLFQVVKWHDGSPLDLSDFVMHMIMTFDPAKPESAIYDESQVAYLGAYLSHFKGVRIASTNPLVIETYENAYQLDAELNVQTWWPNYAYGPSAWHNLGVGIRADAAHMLAFTSAKANALGIEWMNFINGTSLGILQGYLIDSAATNYIPYFPTLASYITAGEAQTRWANLQTWYTTHANFWLGTGPFYLQATTPNLTLQRFADFPDPADKWDFFVQVSSLETNYPDGAPGSYFTLNGDHFPPNSLVHIIVNSLELGTTTTDASGNFTIILATTGAGEGNYMVTAIVNPAATVWFSLAAESPIRPQEGNGTLINVPSGIAYTHSVSLPVVIR
jgi:peptide/nickel transport system substrate-binding protein